MKKLIAIVLSVLAAVAARADQTNVVQNLQIGLIAYTQGPTITNGVTVTRFMNATQLTTVQIIKLLGDATGNTLSPHATLVSIEPLPAGSRTIAIRDGTNVIDVTRFFSVELSDISVSREHLNTRTGVSNGSEVTIGSFGLSTPGAHFTVGGLTRINTQTIFVGQAQLATVDQFTALVAGTGDLGGITAVFQGAISTFGRRFEVVPSSGGGGGGEN